MLQINWIYKTIFLGSLCFISISPCKALYLQDDEINEIYTDGALLGYDLSTQFPAIGTFDNGLGDASCCWKTDTSGGGMIIQYTAATEGWLGLRCEAGQSVAIEYGPVYVSMNTSGTSRPSFDWDQMGVAFHFKGSPEFQSKIAGKVQLEFFDAMNREYHAMVAIDASSTSVHGNCPMVGLDQNGQPNNLAWASIAWQFTPPHSSWYKISKVRISYSVPPGTSVPLTEVLVDQIYLVPWWQKPY